MPLQLLYLLSAADVRDGAGEDTEQLVSSVELFGEYAKELGIWEKSPDIYRRLYQISVFSQGWLMERRGII